MKKVLALICLLAITSSTNAKEIDGSISIENATKEAFKHASDHIFTEILDSDSSVIVKLEGQDTGRYSFVVSARALPQVCLVRVTVSKETGMAFNDEPMICGLIKVTVK